MEFVNIIMLLLINFLECYAWWRLTVSVLQVKSNKNIPLASTIGLFLLMSIKLIIVNSPGMDQYKTLGTLILVVYCLVLLLVFFKNSLLEKVVWLGVYNFVLFIMEILTILTLNIGLKRPLGVIFGDSISMSVIVIGKIMMVLVLEIIIRSHRDKLIMGFSYFKELAAIILFNFLLVLGVVYILTNKNEILHKLDYIILVLFGVVLLITASTVALIFRLEKKSKEEIVTQLKLQQIELELKLNEDMINITDRLRKLRHDMNNHIGLMKNLVQTKQYDELEEYINQVYEDVGVANELVITGNKTLAVLLNAKKSLAKAKNIDFTSMIATQDINMKNKDICTLLGNILDNAIEAAEKSGAKKYIQLMIQKTEEGCVISCENSLGTKPIINKDKFVSRKENSFIHGIGTENIKDIVEKYKGEINIDYDDDMFNVRVVMPV